MAESRNNHFRINRLVIYLGIFWIIDGLLQFQPKLLTSNFITEVIQPTLKNSPSQIEKLSSFLSHIFLLNPIIFGILIGLIQISIGCLIISKKYRMAGLYSSLIWSIFVWIFGQGLGDIFNHKFNFLMGSPGPSLFYILVSIYFILKFKTYIFWSDIVLIFSWLVFWLVQLFSVLLNPKLVYMMFKSPLDHQLPLYLMFLVKNLHNFVSSNLNTTLILMILVSIVASFYLIFNKTFKIIITFLWVIYLSVIFILMQNFNDYYTGLMTDIGILPIIVFIGVILNYTKPQVDNLFRQIEKILF